MEQTTPKKSFLRRLARIVLKTIVFLLIFLILIFLLILTPPVQNFLRKKAVTYLENKLHTKVSVGRIFIGLPKKVVIENLYVEDLQKDTLLSAGRLKVDIGLFKLIFKGETEINNAELENSTIKIKRQLPDTVFNFQFIVDAFSSPDTSAKKDTNSSSAPFAIHKISLDKIRVVYKDVVTGNDITTWLNHFDTHIDKIDPGQLYFDIPDIDIDGLTAKVYQSKPLVVNTTVAPDTIGSGSTNLQLLIKKISLQKIQLDYGNETSAFYTHLDLGKTFIKVNKFDLATQVIDLEDFTLADTKASIQLGRQKEFSGTGKQPDQEDGQSGSGWRIMAASIRLDNNDLRFDNDNIPAEKSGMDYAHLHADSLTLHASKFIMAGDSIGGRISEGRLKEKSGFVLQELKTDFLYTNSQAYLHDLYLKTPGTELKKDASISYASIEALKNDIGNLRFDADIENSKLLVNDILVFVPSLKEQPAFANPSTTWYINSHIKGRVADMQIDALQVKGLQDTKIDIHGSLAGLPDMDKVKADLVIRDISSSKRDIDMFLPAGTLPSNITFPATIHISGNARGNTAVMNTGLLVETNEGNAAVSGRFTQINDPDRIHYDALVQTTSLDIGKILKQEETLGTVTAKFTLEGKGMKTQSAEAVFSGKIQSAVIKQYDYRDLDLKGSIANQQLKASAAIFDPNIHFNLDASADLSKEYPAVAVNMMIDSIKMQPLHLSPELLIYRGKIEGNFSVTDPSAPVGKLYITQSLLVRKEKRLQLDTVQLLAGNSDSGHYIILNSEIVNASLSGQYNLASIGNVFQQAIQPYFALGPAASATQPAPYDFRLNASIAGNPALQTIFPELQRLDSVRLRSHFADSAWTAQLDAPAIDMGTNHIRGLHIEAGTKKEKLDAKASIRQFKSGTSVELNNTSFTASAANNNIDFALNIQDKEQKDKYNLQGLIQQQQAGNYTLSLKRDNLLLNYNKWDISDNNKLIISGGNINAADFILTRNAQQLKITSQSTDADAPMEAEFNNFRLSTLTSLVQPDSSLVDGMITGKMVVVDMTHHPVFTSDLTITDLRVKNDTVGNLHLLVNNKVSNTYNTDITISGKGNDVRLTGNYYPVSDISNFDFVLDIRKLPMKTAEAFSGGSIRNSSGSVNGKFAVKGSIDKPSLNGDLHFDQAAFTLSMLNSHFTIDHDKIGVDGSGIHFNDFAVKDSAGNRLLVNGIAATSNFRNYRFDMQIRANNFQALNSTKKDNELFYGKLFFNTNMTVKGTEELPVIDGRLTVNEKTKMTIVLPQREPGVVDREGVVEFIDRDAPLNDSLFLAPYDSLNVSGFTGMDVSLIIEVDKNADFTLIIDQGNGDFLNVKGEALLSANIDRSGKIILAGTYELQSGSYELSFNLLRRKFEIEKGSKITWEGEPTKATVDIKAKYVANVAPLDLVKGQLSDDITASQRNTYLQKLPFDVILNMEGELLQPKISFDIILPDNKSYIVSNDIITTVRTKLDQLRQEEGEMNKQVFSLLLLNRFVAENPFTSSGDYTSASTLARQSVSKLLTEQLNRLATELVKGVDINFDIQSSEDYTTGQRKDRTDLNVGLSKRLLNDRLTVTVGSNFELEGPQGGADQNNIAGNVAVDYKLSKDGRYLLRAYRKNEYQGVIDGYVVETGVGFIITIDYNRFREIFQNQEKRRKERRERRRQERQEKQGEQNDTGKTPAETEIKQ